MKPLAFLCLTLLSFAATSAAEPEAAMVQRPPEEVFAGELVRFPGPWAFHLGRAGIILTSDEQLEAMSADPDAKLDLSLTHDKVEKSLRQVCEEAQAGGARTLIVAFDHFFKQYRPGQDTPRRLTPDMDEYVAHMATVGKFAESYGLGLELSLLSPLEIGPAYRAATGECGVWMHYRKGGRDPKSGAYSVQLWRQKRWVNNKGPIDIEPAGVRVFAYREARVNGTPYSAVDPAAIVEITDTAQVEEWKGLETGVAERIRVFGEGRADIGPLNRVLVVQQYKTPEMDYFSDKVRPFLHDMLDKYAAAGVKLNGLYADEMHIQQDWGYFNHHDHGEFALRYVSPGFAAKFAERYGAEYRDFAKYLVYFVHGQEDFVHDLAAKAGHMHTFGAAPEAVQQTALFRSRYYQMLQDGVVDLFTEAKHHAEGLMGKRLEARAHATWAESPTIDRWETGPLPHARNQYEYTSNFVWSCTVHQAASACHDYFKWGDFLTGNGNDHAEGGWIDRDYFALALGCSTGILNEVPYSYAAHWGMPHELSRRRMSLVNAYGAAGSPLFGLVQDMQHRDVEVMMLYPLDLVAVEERFGSWMTQYGYANYITQAKLLERGEVRDGALHVAGRRFTTLCTLFEPFPSARLLDMMTQLVDGGGHVVWSGPPPVLTAEGGDALAAWNALFGAQYTPTAWNGLMQPGREIVFESALASVKPQTILTDFLVDRVYPAEAAAGASVVARVAGQAAGTLREAPGGGKAVFLGFRPRDDQAASLGYETRTWFDVLDAIGAYPPTGAFPDVNDNPEYLSRTTPFLTCRFPNGTVAIAPHFRDILEGWPGGFGRDEAEDKAYLEKNPPPSEALELTDFRVNGHTVNFKGSQAMAFRLDQAGNLIGFAGSGDRVAIDGREWVFADAPFGQLAWGPVAEDRRVDGGALMQMFFHGVGVVRIPAAGLPEHVEVIAQGAKPGSRGEVVPSRIENGALVFEVTGPLNGRWLHAVPPKN